MTSASADEHEEQCATMQAEKRHRGHVSASDDNNDDDNSMTSSGAGDANVASVDDNSSSGSSSSSVAGKIVCSLAIIGCVFVCLFLVFDLNSLLIFVFLSFFSNEKSIY